MKFINKGVLEMKRITTIIMIIIILSGIAFSFFNFMSSELNASTMKGAYVDEDCMGDGNECDIGGGKMPDAEV